MKKSFGLGKKNLYLGFAFLVVVGLLSLFIFSGVREGFYGYVEDSQVYVDSSSGSSGSSDSAVTASNTAVTSANTAVTSANTAAAPTIGTKCVPKSGSVSVCGTLTSANICKSNTQCKWV